MSQNGHSGAPATKTSIFLKKNIVLQSFSH